MQLPPSGMGTLSNKHDLASEFPPPWTPGNSGGYFCSPWIVQDGSLTTPQLNPEGTTARILGSNLPSLFFTRLAMLVDIIAFRGRRASLWW